ncbi:ThiF family adenylyltransferase [Bacillus daqingensis]|uniref:ThiF family adenylyltransferase n=1 Tax=Bacillus daqingensis TaxID=872396 RepID=A0ABV9NST6_9BACI
MKDRYSRQELFAPIGMEGQKQISHSSVLIAGAGALGSAIAETMVRAGVGSVAIVDRDYVEPSNLQRQQLYTEQDALEQKPKATAAEERLRQINSGVHIKGITGEITPELLASFKGADLILDGLDNFETRLLLNDFCSKYSIPWIYGACVASGGLACTILPGKTACLSCIVGAVPAGGDTCDTAGILGPVVQMTAAYQTAEALKLLSGNLDKLRDGMVRFDLWEPAVHVIGTSKMKQKNCPSCGEEAVYPFLNGSGTRLSVLCGRDTVQVRPSQTVDIEEVLQRLKPLVQLQNEYLLQLDLEGTRTVLFRDGRALMHGLSNTEKALRLYQRFISG